MKLRAFTLLEVTIGLAIVGLMLAVVVPSVSALSGAELKKTTGMLQGLMRDTYARAALSGQAHRVVLDLEAGSYWVEGSEGGVVLKRKKLELSREGKAALDKADERIEDIADDTRDQEEQEKLRLYRHPTWTPVPFPGESRVDEVKPARLPSDVVIKRVWVDHLEEAATGGQVAITFFPGGYTQEAHVTLTDDAEDPEGRTLTLVVHPLTGEVFVEDRIPDVPHD